MLRSRVAQGLRWLAFAVVLIAAAAVRERPGSAVDMAIVWLPSGVAVAGVFILGLPAALVVAAATLIQRWLLGYDWSVGVTAAFGSSFEAVIGAVILRRLGVQPSFTRLRDLGAVLAASALAPFGSILGSWLGRTWFWADRGMPFYSGWDGWWRMNALAVIMVVPAVLSHLRMPGRELTPRFVGRAFVGIAAVSGILLALLLLLPPGAVGVMWLNLALIGSATFVAARFGVRGATLGTVVTGLVVVVATTYGIGPFMGLPRGDRHVALQLFELALVALPPASAAIIAERRVAEAAVRRSETLLASISRNVQDGLFRLDPDLRLVFSNQALARMLGHDGPEELLGRSLTGAFADPARREGVLGLLRRQGHVHNEEVRFQRHDGSEFWGLVSGVAVHETSDVVSCYDGAITDITQRKALEEQVRQSQKLEAVGRLAGGVAHDFNNLLTVILGYAETLRLTAPPGDPASTHAEAITEAGTRAAALTRQLLAYSRRQVLSPEVIDVCAVVDQMAGMLQRIIGEDVILRVEHRSGPCWVRVDRSQLEQVLFNLAVNARDAMRNGGTLTLATSLEAIEATAVQMYPDRYAGPCVMIRVRDTGIGMDITVLSQAFEPFFTTKGPGRGTGLGLATVYGIVKQSGGSVWLESEPGDGTTACIALPRAAAPVETVPAEPTPQHVPGARVGTVLLVEDEPALLLLVGRTLESRGYRVLAAGDGARALDIAREVDGKVDLVVTDLVMPGIDGRELAGRLVARWPGLRVLFMSGYLEGVGTMEELMGPGYGFIAKPFSPDTLLSKVDELLVSAETPRVDGQPASS